MCGASVSASHSFRICQQVARNFVLQLVGHLEAFDFSRASVLHRQASHLCHCDFAVRESPRLPIMDSAGRRLHWGPYFGTTNANVVQGSVARSDRPIYSKRYCTFPSGIFVRPFWHFGPENELCLFGCGISLSLKHRAGVHVFACKSVLAKSNRI